ncbi:MAG: SAM-dependent methyltransferase [Lachnospiraceae bacterium]|nr:SAM-dependent methyltransferase [Lachnospiraceae bacterium]
MEKIIGMVPECRTAADIGTDHGFLPIALVRRGKAGSAIASDLRKGPLAAARAHIEEAGLSGRIETRLGSGLSTVRPGEADVIVIAGMGGMLMRDILLNGQETARSASSWVLSPHTDRDAVRRTVYELGFRIEDEDMAEEDGKYYPVLRCVPGGDAIPGKGDGACQKAPGEADSPKTLGETDSTDAPETLGEADSTDAPETPGTPGACPLTGEELRYGPVLLRKKPEAFLKYLKAEKGRMERARDRIAASSPDAGKRPEFLEITARIAEIGRILGSGTPAADAGKPGTGRRARRKRGPGPEDAAGRPGEG